MPDLVSYYDHRLVGVAYSMDIDTVVGALGGDCEVGRED